MERPWENRPEFLPSLVVYSVAFLVGKKKERGGFFDANISLNTQSYSLMGKSLPNIGYWDNL